MYIYIYIYICVCVHTYVKLTVGGHVAAVTLPRALSPVKKILGKKITIRHNWSTDHLGDYA